MAQTALVRRPLEVAFGLLIAFAVLGLIAAFFRYLFTDFTPFNGRMMEAGMTAFMIVLWVVFALGVAAVVMWAVFTFAAPALVHSFGKTPAEWSTFAAVSDLKRRYAKGEITREEYLQKMEDLEGQNPATALPPAAQV